MNENLRKNIDGVFKNILDYQQVAQPAYQVEAALGKLQSKGEYSAEDANDGWAYFCRRGVDIYRGDLDYPNPPLSPGDIRDGLHDNDFHTVMATFLKRDAGADLTSLPVCAWAAFNKRTYEGFEDEIACLRCLLVMGFDVNIADENSLTALHYMSSMKVAMQSHPRAVRLLLEAGANPNLRNRNGDTPLCLMAGNPYILPNLEESFSVLLNAGANPTIAANDGATAISLLSSGERSEAKARILARIAQL